MSVPIETEVAGLGLGTGKSVYVDVKTHLEDNNTTLDIIDSHDVCCYYWDQKQTCKFAIINIWRSHVLTV